MKLTRINIEKLFGQFDYNITLNQEEGITILTGPNGYGKTTILNIIWGFFNQQFDLLQEIKIEKFSLLFDNGKTLVFTKGKEQGKNTLIPLIVFTLQIDVFAGNEKIETEKHVYDPSGGNAIKFTRDIISGIIQSQNIYLIKDQRLTYSVAAKYDGTLKYNGKNKHDGVAVLNKIELFSKDLAERIAQIKSEEDKLALSLADTFPERLLKYNQSLPQNVFEARFKQLSEKQQRLQLYGMNPGTFTRSEYEGENRRILSVYLEDYERKTALYEDLLIKIDMFFSILNMKKLINKAITIKAGKGFCFETAAGIPLKLSALSSGEQHQVILLYELLFNVPPDSIVLIDEPETSMHVAWQIEFIRDLKKISKIKPLSFVVATHSPDIINENTSIVLYERIHGGTEGDAE
jgi:ABC-type cobalamin/Fe3+-siderophores transport system ATPase subunit